MHKKKIQNKNIFLIGKIILIILSLAFLFYRVYSPHLSYKYPFSIDEWYHISMAKAIKQEGINFLKHPAVYGIEVGFQIILLIINIFTPLISIYKFLPALNAVIIACVLFYFLIKRYNFWAGLLSILFVASLKSNISVLGLWFYVPIAGSIIFNLACLFLLEESLKEPKKVYYVAILLAIITLVHTSSFLVIGLTVAIFYLLNYRYVKENYKDLKPYLILIIPALIIINNFKGALNISSMIWGLGDTPLVYNPIIYYGVLSSFFALIGYYFTFKEKKLLPFRIYIIIPLINLILFPITQFSIFSAYQRYMLHFMSAAVPLSAVGLFKSVTFVGSLIDKLKKLIKLPILINIFKYFILSLIILISFIIIFRGYYDLPFQVRLYTLIDDRDYEAMLFLKDYRGPGMILKHQTQAEILAPIYPGSAMSAITEKSSLTGLVYHNPKENQIAIEFFNGNCSKKREIAYHNYYMGLKYIYSYWEIDCDFLEEIYRNEKVVIYEIKK